MCKNEFFQSSEMKNELHAKFRKKIIFLPTIY